MNQHPDQGHISDETNYKVSRKTKKLRQSSPLISFILLLIIIGICFTIIYLQSQNIKSLEKNLEKYQYQIEGYQYQIDNLKLVQQDIAGTIKGKLSQKMDIPAKVCVQLVEKFDLINCIKLQKEQTEFELNAKPGKYYLFAQSEEHSPNEFPVTMYHSDNNQQGNQNINKPGEITLKAGDVLTDVDLLDGTLCNQSNTNLSKYCKKAPKDQD